MAIPDLLNSSIAIQQILQYPDKNLYKAATLLKPEERPTVPVRTYADSKIAYDQILKPLGHPGLSENALGFTPKDKSAIYLKSDGDTYKDVKLLASKLAHEQTHVKSDSQEAELPAYLKELEVVKRLKASSPYYRDRLQAYVDMLKHSPLEQALLARQGIK